MSSINLRINELAEEFFCGNNTKFAEFISTNEANIRNYRFKTEPKIEFLINLSKKLEISYEWLLTGEGEKFKTNNTILDKNAEKISKNVELGSNSWYKGNTNFSENQEIIAKKTNDIKNSVPLFDAEAAAGVGSFSDMLSNHNIIEHYDVPLFKDCDFMIHVRGSSMQPKYYAGDVIACKILHEIQFLMWGRIYVIATKEHGFLVKRVQESSKEETILAVSDNPNYPPFGIPKSEILGFALVKGVIRLE